MPIIKLNNRSIKDVTSLPFGVGNLIHISSQTASNSASISFTTGIDSTYKEYQFYFIDIHARNDGVDFTFNFSTDSGSNYNVTKTSTSFEGYHYESDSSAGLQYRTDFDLAQSTAFQIAMPYLGNGADELGAGSMQLFNPSSTSFVKHFIIRTVQQGDTDYARDGFYAGYGNTTSAINAVQFKMSSGNFDGTIALFGVV